MRLSYLTVLILAVIALFGCSIGEDFEVCPDIGKAIEFRYLGDGDVDIFGEKIEKVDFYIFDQAGSYITSVVLNKQDLGRFQGVRLNLEPGTYRYVAWGNAQKNTLLPDVATGQNLNNIYLINGVTHDGYVSSSDSLYYANAGGNIADDTFTVSTNEDEQAEIVYFNSAHIKFKVFVKGYDELELDNPRTAQVKLTGLQSQYDFKMRSKGDKVVYNNTGDVVTIGESKVSLSSFYTPRLDGAKPIVMDVLAGTNEELHTQIDILEFIEKNNIDINKQELTISILIEYKGLEVVVSIPKWEIEDVEPEL